MFYFKPIIKKVLSDPGQIEMANEIDNDKDALKYLISLGKNKESIMSTFEKHYGFEYVDLKRKTIHYSDVNGWDMNRLKRQLVIPFDLDKGTSTQYFAINEMMNQKLKSELSAQCKRQGLKPEFLFAFKHEIIKKHEDMESTFVEPIKEVAEGDFDAEDWANEIIVRGIDLRASDIHIETLEVGMQVRYRVDGLLTEKKFYPYDSSISSTIIVRIKIISGMDISEKRKPQDGRLDNFSYNKNLYDFRVSSIKTIYGEKIVMRIFNKTSGILSFENIGFSKDDENKIKRLLKNKNGILYLAGATGSGKTTTLYSMIDQINTDDINIYTIEDPVEKTIKNVNQIQIDPLAGIDYANTLKALLRQDPDVMVVGEIRDIETAELSIRSSLTGHLVMTTIHSNNAIDSISRLIDMEVEPYLLSASSLAFLSQRLVRKLCPYCKSKIENPTIDQLAWLKSQEEEYGVSLSENATLYEPVGCSQCSGGYRGRTAVVEILEITDELKKIIKAGESNKTIKEVAIAEGFVPLSVNALRLVENGTTSINEVIREI